MIIKEKMTWIHMLMTLKGSSFEESWPRIAGATLIAVIVTAIEMSTGIDKTYTLTPVPFTILGVAISIFLGFRNKIAYDRF